MITYQNKQKRGISIIAVLIFIFLVLIVLGYFNVSVKSVVESPLAQENINYVGGAGKTLWERYLKDPAIYLWSDIWVNIFWKSFVNNMERIRDGKPTDLEEASPKVNFN